MAEKMIQKSDWVSSFNLVGRVKINDYTYKIDEKSEKSAWIYNSVNLGVDCGEKYGVVYCELMGGYSDAQPSVIYAHGKHDDGTDDFGTQIQVAWDDRFNEDVLQNIGELSFIKVGLEKTDKNNTFVRKFLSPYDAIACIKEHLEDEMVVNIRGNLKYSMYNDKTQVRKNITSIFLSSKEPEEYKAKFTQTILIDKDSVSLKNNVDKDKGVLYVDARVLDYVKELNGNEIKGQYPFYKRFEFEIPKVDEKTFKLIVDKLFKVKKDITQITFEGEFIEGGAVVTATMDDLSDDIKLLITLGVYTEEESLAKCSTSGNREQRMVLTKPYTKKEEVGGKQMLSIPKYEERYTEEDLTFNFANNTDSDFMPFPTEDGDNNAVDDWLNAL